MTTKLHSTHDVPFDTDIPGIYKSKNKEEWRVPFNCHKLLGLTLPRYYDAVAGMRLAQNIMATSPIMRQDTGLTLRDYQLGAIAHTINMPGSFIWIPPGGGKTVCSLVWLVPTLGQKVVVCRAGARKTWAEEIAKWTNFRPVILTGKAPDATKLSGHPRAVHIIGWETLAEWADLLSPEALVLDETHMAKSSKRAVRIIQADGSEVWEDRENLTAAAAKLSKRALRRVGLTGTPVPNLVRDLWAQLDLMEPWQWGGMRSFGMRYCGGHHNGYGYVYDGYSNGDELKARLATMAYRVLPSRVQAGMPMKTRIVRRIPRSEQDTPARGFANDIKRAAKSGDAMVLQEILISEAATRKRTAVITEIIEHLKSSRKVVVLSGRHADCEVLHSTLVTAVSKLRWETPPKLWLSHGGHTIAARDKVRIEYMGDKAVGRSPHAGPCCLIGSADAWGESLNLQDTDVAIMVMLPYTPRQLEQREQRFQRLGGTRKVLILYMVAEGTIDDDVIDNIVDKLPAVEDIVAESGIAGIEAEFVPPPMGSLLDYITSMHSKGEDSE